LLNSSSASNSADKRLAKVLIEVTLQLLAETRSVKLPTMREIAAKANVTPGAAYRHFASQSELLLAVVSELYGRLGVQLSNSVKLGESPEKSIRAMAHAYVKWGLANPGQYQLLFETTDDAETAALGKRPGLHLTEMVATLLGHHFQLGRPDYAKAVVFWSQLHGLVSLYTHKTALNWPSDISRLVDQAIDLHL
jgi:AcrR family transcriptional regulator